jgi:hypothetical protein
MQFKVLVMLPAGIPILLVGGVTGMIGEAVVTVAAAAHTT